MCHKFTPKASNIKLDELTHRREMLKKRRQPRMDPCMLGHLIQVTES